MNIVVQKQIPSADLAFSQSVCKKHHALVIKNGNYRALIPSHDFFIRKRQRDFDLETSVHPKQKRAVGDIGRINY